MHLYVNNVWIEFSIIMMMLMMTTMEIQLMNAIWVRPLLCVCVFHGMPQFIHISMENIIQRNIPFQRDLRLPKLL